MALSCSYERFAGFRAEPEIPLAMDNEAERTSTGATALHGTCLAIRMERLRRLSACVAEVLTKRPNENHMSIAFPVERNSGMEWRRARGVTAFA